MTISVVSQDMAAGSWCGSTGGGLDLKTPQSPFDANCLGVTGNCLGVTGRNGPRLAGTRSGAPPPNETVPRPTGQGTVPKVHPRIVPTSSTRPEEGTGPRRRSYFWKIDLIVPQVSLSTGLPPQEQPQAFAISRGQSAYEPPRADAPEPLL